MPLKSDEFHNVTVLTVDGEFSGETTAALRRCAEERLASNKTDFVIDLDKTSFIDSAALETLLWLKSRCDDAVGRLKLAPLSELAKKVLEITRLDHRFECADTLAAALKAMR